MPHPLPSLLLISLIAIPGIAQSIDISKPEKLRLIGVKAEVLPFKGKTALRLIEADPPQTPDPREPPKIAIVPGVQFKDGTIELDIAGQPASGAPEGARGFVGIAFRVQGDAERYEYIYIRPTNGRANDQVRRNHSTQYSSHPDYPWFRLRKEEPKKYESYVDLEPGVWTKFRITVSGATARLFVHEAAQPCLIVNDLKLGASRSGGIALWIGNGADGYFANLRVRSE